MANIANSIASLYVYCDVEEDRWRLLNDAPLSDFATTLCRRIGGCYAYVFESESQTRISEASCQGSSKTRTLARSQPPPCVPRKACRHSKRGRSGVREGRTPEHSSSYTTESLTVRLTISRRKAVLECISHRWSTSWGEQQVHSWCHLSSSGITKTLSTCYVVRDASPAASAHYMPRFNVNQICLCIFHVFRWPGERHR